MKIHLKQFLSTLEFVAVPVLIAAGVPPVIANDVKLGIGLAEKVSAAKGDITHPMTNEEKKAIAMDAARAAIQTTNDAKPGTLDPTEVLSVADHAIDTTVGVVNLVHTKK